jgi:hypothetical protein
VICHGGIFHSPAAAQVGSASRLKKAPSEPFGYTAAFDQELHKIGQISPQEFAQRNPTRTAHLDAIRWDPTTARFWDQLNLDPKDVPQPNEVVGIKVAAEDVAGGFVEPHCRVDITAVIQRNENKTYAKVILQNILVLAVDQMAARPEDKMARIPSTVTVEVTPDQAEKLGLAMQLGRIKLTLRATGDKKAVTTRGVTPKGILQRGNDRPPRQIPAGSRGKPRTGTPYDFRLNQEELALFKRNGFVVSERMGGANFGEVFYRIYSRDLPIFISSDALLHAWHRSYDAMLQEIEENCLEPSLEDILAAMAEAVPESRSSYGEGPLGDCLADADYFLAVARSLLAGRQVNTTLGHDERVGKTLGACAALQLEDFPLFGRVRAVDFSQFKPRGHYETSERLQRYFRAMMWCGRIDLRLAGTEESSPRELGAAIVLQDLLQRSGRWERWQHFDRILETFVGQTDSMTFAQLGAILTRAGFQSPADVKGLATLTRLQSDILSGKAGLQQIRGDVYFSPLGPEKIQLPRSFTVLGQKFVLDSWVTAKAVYDDIHWDGEKVRRRIPAALDVAFAAFGNDQVVPDLVARMTNARGRRFRDGLNYQHNLAAVRNVIDAQSAKAWDANLYLNWLACLRELSRPTTDPRYPEAVRTRAWAMKALNTQLASWTQLRHDTVLYAKQSYTGVPMCFYPAGYVEPVPHFWARFEKMATRAAELIEQTPYPDYLADERVWKAGKPVVQPVRRRGKDLQAKQAGFFRNFARQVGNLNKIAAKELAGEKLNAAETKFLEDTVQLARASGFAGYNGWYPGLFYSGRRDCEDRDALVADVHTDPPSEQDGDPGCVLHQGVGNVDLLVLAVDSGSDHMIYAGPVLSHYEFEMAGVSRKSDREWREDLNGHKAPPRPNWTNSYLVPADKR